MGNNGRRLDIQQVRCGSLHSPNAQIVAVASQSEEKAKQFAQQYGIDRAYGNYDEFVQDDEVEIVYIGTLHPMHKDGALRCLKAGKAVLCEKPFTMDAAGSGGADCRR